MEWYEPEVRALEARRVAEPPPPGLNVFYGSSSIRLWSTLARDVGDPCALNLGFGGSTLEACVHFFDRLVPPVQPGSLVLYAGDNDLGDGQPADSVVGSLSRFLTRLSSRLPGIPFAFLSIKPSPSRYHLFHRIRQVNQAAAALLRESAQWHYIDVFAAMLDVRGLPRPELFEADGLHLNAAGYKTWTECFAPYRNRLFMAHCSQIDPTGLSSTADAPRVPLLVQPLPEP